MSAIATMPAPTGENPRPWKWTREQYYHLGDLGVFEGKRVELIRGEIIEMSPIHWPHAYTTGLVAQALAQVFSSGYWFSIQQPFAIPGTIPGSEPQPDVVCVAGSLRGTPGHPTVAALIVEVADSTLFYDTTTKAELYASAGVHDYWVVDINGRQLHVFRDPQPLATGLGTTAFRTHLILGDADTIAPVAVSTATIRVADLLP